MDTALATPRQSGGSSPWGESFDAAMAEALGVSVEATASARATRLSMRFDSRSGGVRVTVPAGVGRARVEEFLRKHQGWISRQARALPERTRLLPGTRLGILGVERLIRQDTSSRAPARLADGPEGPEVIVGRTDFPESRVVDLLREEARRHMTAVTREKASAIERPFRSVRIKDTTSRWGSCSSTGEISYSWRIVLAPPDIAGYLAAHEVAHLVEMNHGPRFWRICEALSPVRASRARAWLQVHGDRLMRCGPG